MVGEDRAYIIFTMDAARIIPGYLLWHYTKALVGAFVIWKDAVWFIGHYFSIRVLLLSLFSPWKRITEERKRSFDLENIASVILVGLISRIIGAVVRLVIVIVGIVALILSFISIVVFYLFWITAPFVITLMLVYGVVLVF